MDHSKCRRAALIAALAAASAVLVSPGCGTGTRAARQARPNVLLIVVDALRADRLECYGYGRPTSPNLNALAAEGMLFTDAMAQAAETVTSIPSLLTGRRPGEHGRVWERRGSEVYRRKGARLPTLAELLKEQGYMTAAVSANPLVGPSIGIDRGFDYFDQSCGQVAAWQLKSADKVNLRAYHWLAQYRPEQGPFFLYLHYLDTHNQYRPPPAFCIFGRPGYTPRDNQINAEMNGVFDPLTDPALRITDDVLSGHGLSRVEVERLSDLYDGEVLCADHYIGELLQRLKELGLYDNSIVVLTADHGEAFLEHQTLEHGGALYQELVHVPLIIRIPGIRGAQEVAELVESVDVVPTILEAVGVNPEGTMSGRSLYQALVRGEGIPARVGLAELPGRRMFAVRVGALKLISSPAGVECYDLSQDPGETRNLAPARPDLVARLQGALRDLLAQQPPAAQGAEPASESDLEALRALGYLK